MRTTGVRSTQRLTRACGAASVSPAFAKPSRRQRAVRVVAFKDPTRNDRLVETAKQFVNNMMRCKNGEADNACSTMDQYVDEQVEYRMYNVGSWEGGKGLPAFDSQVRRSGAKFHVKSHRVIACAANPETDVVFCMVESFLEDSSVHYQLFKIAMLLDETANRVVEVVSRGQLTQENLRTLAKDPSLAHPLTAFPVHDIVSHTKNFSLDVAQKAGQAWCKARCSGAAEDALDSVTNMERFRLWDAYGVLPVLCDPSKSAMRDACVVPGTAIKDIIRSAKTGYDIDCKLVDTAASDEFNLAFNQWQSKVTNKESGKKFLMEGMEVVLFDDAGRVTDIWMFRDPMDSERAMLQPQMAASS